MALPTRSETFKGVNVLLSRNLVPPEMYDSLHDALRLNGARVFLCSDRSRNSPNDYHVISSLDHEKFEDLKANGCNLVGPHCVLSCAKERRLFPNKGYTCCLAMEGVNVLASGFENEEKVHIALLVSAMGGILQSKTSLELDFVIVKNVLSAKYKWAAEVLKKPIVNINWLHQCWAEHRLVPHEPYRVFPFTGLTICVTRIAIDERKEIERLILQNGGQYSGDLTKKCTHLVCDAPGGDKYVVAERWGHIQIVSRRWVSLSVARKVCLSEEHYRVSQSSVSRGKFRNSQKEQPSQDRISSFQLSSADACEDLTATSSQKVSATLSDATTVTNDNDSKFAPLNEEENAHNHVAEDSEDEDNDLYLANCRIMILGFEEKEMRRLVSLIRKGGGSRHMLLSERLTHIILGMPTESERKEVRQLAAFGVINLVKQVWLEDCDRARKEIPVSLRHAYSNLLPTDSFPVDNSPLSAFDDVEKGNNLPDGIHVTSDQNTMDKNYGEKFALRRIRGKESSASFLQERSTDSVAAQRSKISGDKTVDKLSGSNTVDSDVDLYKTPLNIFKGCSFTFSHSFPEDQKAEIVDWVKKGGGLMVSGENARFIIERHGIMYNLVGKSTTITSHWIRSCLEEGFLQDVSSHILYSPLRCQLPFPGLGGFKFCVSQYDTKERQLLRNLCFTLGSKCTEKLTRKITHLLCKFASGPKYEAACNWGIQSVTAEWITECIRRNMLVSLDSYRPKPVTAQEREAGICTSSQYPTQAARLISGEDPSQSQAPTQYQMPVINSKHPLDIGSDVSSITPKLCKSLSKRSKVSQNDDLNMLLREEAHVENMTGDSLAIPDMAAAIEDLLAQSNKIQDMKLPDVNSCDKNAFATTQPVQGQVRVNSHQNFIITDWSGREQKKPSGPDVHLRLFDSFSETQTESQVVGYEEDLAGRQQIIERVRSQSLNSTPASLPTEP